MLAGQKKKANENAFLSGVRPLAKKDLVHGRNRNRCIAVHLNDEELAGYGYRIKEDRDKITVERPGVELKRLSKAKRKR